MKSRGSRFSLFSVLNYTIFGLFTFTCFFPFYYLFIQTISNNDLSSRGLVLFYPIGFHLDNYTQVFQIPGLWNATMISISRTVLGTLLTVLASALLGFLFTKQEMWGRKIWYRMLILTMYLNAGFIPGFMVMLKLGLVNNFLAYIIPGIVAPFNVVLTKTYVESLPVSLQESAQMDGAGYFTVFWKIVFPLMKPILATIALFTAVGQWNSFTDTLILMSNQDLYTLQFILYKYMNEANNIAQIMRSAQSGAAAANLANAQTSTSIITTVSMFTVIPILLVYPFLQRYLVKGMMIGAVKG